MNARWIVSIFAALAMAGGVLAQPANEAFAKGLRAYTDGDTTAARAFLEEALKTDPKNKQAALLLQRIQMQERVGGDLESRAAKVMIPEVNFKDASLTTVLDYLPEAASQHSNGQFALNMIRLFPPEYGAETKVTLSLRNVPLSEVIKYVAQVAGLSVQYQPSAVVLSRPQAKE